MKLLLSIAFCFLVLFNTVISQIIHVPNDQATIQAGIDAASDGDTVLVAPGEYFENVNLSKSIVLSSQFILEGDTMHIRNTIINGSSTKSPTILIENTSKPINPTLKGFTITGGEGRYFDYWLSWCGGGVYITSSATIANNLITENNLLFEEEICHGGGIFCYLSNDEVVEIVENSIIDNSLTALEGAGGAGITIGGRTTEASVKIIGNKIIGNTVSVEDITYWHTGGGGIYLEETIVPDIIKNVIASNSAPYGGGVLAYHIETCRINLINNTITENEATVRGGGLAISNGRANIANTILWGNTAPLDSNISVRGEIGMTYSISQQQFNGIGNIQIDPNLNDDFSLSNTSLAIDAGNPDVVFNDIEDEEHLGNPLLPAQGELLNDIGATGGNYHMILPDSTYGILNRLLYGEYEGNVYRYIYPINYDSTKKYPMTVALHEQYRHGTDNEIHTRVGLHWRMNAEHYNYNEFTLIPQNAVGPRWDVDKLYSVIQSFRKTFPIDSTRINIVGWSEGGLGVSALIGKYSKLICAGIPVSCSDYFPLMKHTPLWVVHGDEDEGVSVQRSRTTIASYEETGLKAIRTKDITNEELTQFINGGSRLLYTEIEGGNHHIFRYTFDDINKFNWLNKFRKPLIYPDSVWTNKFSYSKTEDSVITNFQFLNPENHNDELIARMECADNDYKSELNIYDDGLHNDNQANDGIWGNTFPPLNEEQFYMIGVNLIDEENGTENYFHNLATITTVPAPDVQIVNLVEHNQRDYQMRLYLTNSSSTCTLKNIKIRLWPADTSITSFQPEILSFSDTAPDSSNQSELYLYVDVNDSFNGLLNFKYEILLNDVAFWGVDSITDISVSVDEYEKLLPNKFAINQNYPNPFNPNTIIEYEIPNESKVQLKIFDILGRAITTLVNSKLKPGFYEVEFDASNLTSGIYFYRIEAGTFVETKKMVLMK